VSDFPGNGLIQEASRASIDTQNVNLQISKRRRSKTSARNQLELQHMNRDRASATIDHGADSVTNMKKQSLVSPFGSQQQRNQFMSILEHPTTVDIQDLEERSPYRSPPPKGSYKYRTIDHERKDSKINVKLLNNDAFSRAQLFDRGHQHKGSLAGMPGSSKNAPSFTADTKSATLVLPSVHQARPGPESSKNFADAQISPKGGRNLFSYASLAPHQVGNPTALQLPKTGSGVVLAK